MVMTDPISDLLTRIRNAIQAEHSITRIPHSSLKERILELMESEGYIAGFEVEREGHHGTLTVQIKRGGESGTETVIKGMRRESRPGQLPTT